MENINIHDNQIYKYAVDHDKHEIVLNTRSEDKKLTDIIFCDVVAYLLEDTIMGCIILDLEEWSAEDLIMGLGEEYILKHKNYDWPFTFKDLDDFKNQVRDKGITIYCLSSSFGMNGFILAKSIKYATK